MKNNWKHTATIKLTIPRLNDEGDKDYLDLSVTGWVDGNQGTRWEPPTYDAEIENIELEGQPWIGKLSPLEQSEAIDLLYQECYDKACRDRDE